MGVSQEVLVKLSEGNPIGEEVFEYLAENIEMIHSEVENTMRKTFSLQLVYFYESTLPVESRLRIPADLANGEFYKAYASDYS